ncbi:hypothetical protein VP01_2126g6 [Puccinia sorghi]|uniref:Uncharacterized protein n=1 Tax=Puccinia sorghi TaxID=27349 RepID=A0A0L6V9U2_9BASI|nr:hypothetical protein VP01_2126g6 [Puccinia sorghi]
MSANSIEGYLVIVYLHQKGRALLTGTQLGQTFLGIILEEPDPCGLFLSFVKVQEELKKISGAEPLLPKRKRKSGAMQNMIETSKYDLGQSADVTFIVVHQFESSLGQQFWLLCWIIGVVVRASNGLAKLGIQLRVKKTNAINFMGEELCKRPADMSVGQMIQVLMALGEGPLVMSFPMRGLIDHPEWLGGGLKKA